MATTILNKETTMSSTGLEVFDKTLQTTNIWLNGIGETLGPDKQRCYHAMRAVLFALRDRLTPEQAFHLSAELPMLIRGIYWEGYRPTDKPDRQRTKEDFLEAVNSHIGNIQPMNVEDATTAVFRILAEHVDPGEAEKVKQNLPEPIRVMFP